MEAYKEVLSEHDYGFKAVILAEISAQNVGIFNLVMNDELSIQKMAKFETKTTKTVDSETEDGNLDTSESDTNSSISSISDGDDTDEQISDLKSSLFCPLIIARFDMMQIARIVAQNYSTSIHNAGDLWEFGQFFEGGGSLEEYCARMYVFLIRSKLNKILGQPHIFLNII